MPFPNPNNVVIQTGRIYRLKTIESNGKTLCAFTIGVQADRNKETGKFDYSYTECFCPFDATAKFILQYFEDGKNICVLGALSTKTKEREGFKFSETKVVVASAQFPPRNADADGPTVQDAADQRAKPKDPDPFKDGGDDDLF